MEYLCERKIVHGEVGARNVLVTEYNFVKFSHLRLPMTQPELDEEMKEYQLGKNIEFKWQAPER